MVLVNRTNHAVGTAFGRSFDGRPALFVTVKSTYGWDRSGAAISTDPIPVVTDDERAGDGPTTTLLRAAEVGPPKPRLDVLLAGAIVFPRPVESIDVTMAVGDWISKTVRVMGARVWVPGVMREVVPSRPVPLARVPIDWRCSFGGTDPTDASAYEPRNPAGSGLARLATALKGKPVPVFEDPGDLISSWKSRPAPRGFGPVSSHWQPRVGRAGTYDERWKRERFPLPPADFDPIYYNVAPDDQQLQGYAPGSTVRLRHMTLSGHDAFQLPPFEPSVLVATDEALIEATASVDTIVIEPEQRCFSLIARATCPVSAEDPTVHEIVIGVPTAGHRRALEKGKRYRHRRERKAGVPA